MASCTAINRERSTFARDNTHVDIETKGECLDKIGSLLESAEFFRVF